MARRDPRFPLPFTQDIDRLKALGADFVINYRTEDVEARVLEITEGFGVHGIFDTGAAFVPVLESIQLPFARKSGIYG